MDTILIGSEFVMRKYIVGMSALLVIGLCALGMAADIDGTWESERQGRQGQGTTITTYIFKSDGAELTGTISGGRGGDMEITDGVIDGENISFTVVRSFNDNEMITKYKGTVSGDELLMTSEREGGFGGFGGGGGAPGGMGAPPSGGAGGAGGGMGGGGPRGPREIIAKRVQ